MISKVKKTPKILIFERGEKYFISVKNNKIHQEDIEVQTIGTAIDWCLKNSLEPTDITYKNKIYSYNEFKKTFIEFFI